MMYFSYYTVGSTGYYFFRIFESMFKNERTFFFLLVF